tara:strand:+ start:67 stop:645 length:579 start_codon:yes stop_codon:yes gene_type:complete
MVRIIGLLGNKCSGKDTAGNYLVEKYGYKRYAFADPIKEIARHLFNLSDVQLYGNKKEEIDERWNLKPRTIFQRLGTEFGQYTIYNIFPELKEKFNTRQLWIYHFNLWVKEEIKKNKNINIVITDVRFGHEIEEIKKHGGEIIKISNPKLKKFDKHISEIEIKTLKYDDNILNNKDLSYLYKQLDIIAQTPF